MLSMKTLRVAIVTMGSALLFGPGLAAAQDNTVNLNAEEAPTPLVYAQETLPAQADRMGRRALELENAMDVAVKPRRAIATGEGVYLRIDLSGAQFGSAPVLVSGAADAALGENSGSSLSSGGADAAFAVFQVGAVQAGQLVGVRIGSAATGDLQLTTTTGNVTASIAAYTDPDDALDQVGGRSTFAGSGAIIRLQSGLNVTIKAAPEAKASVDTGFMRFVGGGGTARLGWLGVEESVGGTASVRNADDGAAIEVGDIIAAPASEGDPPVGTVSFNVMGNLDIGAFNIKAETFEMTGEEGSMVLVMKDGAPVPNGTCDGGMANVVDRGDLLGSDRMPLIGEEGELPSGVDSANTTALAPDVYLLCVNVDVTGAMSNMMPIPKSDYSATAHIKRDAGVNTPVQMVGEEGKLASIDRDGASVELPYLTTSDKHNQRLIVVNRGTRPVAVTSIQFNSEAGTDAELSATAQAAMDAGQLVVPAGGTWVARMDESLNITGGSRRTAATIAFAGTKEVLSVATTQVNLEDGSTDTVVYTVVE